MPVEEHGVDGPMVRCAGRPRLRQAHALLNAYERLDRVGFTRATALARNRLVLALATERCVPYLSPDSPLQSLVAVAPNWKMNND